MIRVRSPDARFAGSETRAISCLDLKPLCTLFDPHHRLVTTQIQTRGNYAIDKTLHPAGPGIAAQDLLAPGFLAEQTLGRNIIRRLTGHRIPTLGRENAGSYAAR